MGIAERNTCRQMRTQGGSSSTPVPERPECNLGYIIESRPIIQCTYDTVAIAASGPHRALRCTDALRAPGGPAPSGDAPPQCGHADDRRGRPAGAADRPNTKAVTAPTARVVATSRANFSTKAVMAHLHQADGWVVWATNALIPRRARGAGRRRRPAVLRTRPLRARRAGSPRHRRTSGIRDRPWPSGPSGRSVPAVRSPRRSSSA